MIAMPRRMTGLLSGPACLRRRCSPSAARRSSRTAASVGPIPLATTGSATSAFLTPPTTADCDAQIGIACYSPRQFQKAYNLGPLYKQGLNGKGETIVIVDSYGFQGIGQELNDFDKSSACRRHRTSGSFSRRPDPAVQPDQAPEMVGWAQETSLDVEYAHAIAPDANILLVETTVAETLGVKVSRRSSRRRTTSSITISATSSRRASRHRSRVPECGVDARLRSDYKNAAANGVTVLAASGDAGPSGAKTLTPQGFADNVLPSPRRGMAR